MNKDAIVIVDYDSAWPQQFEEEAMLLRQTLDSTLITRIEHFGSTAVPGLAAKPIIDLLIGVTSLEQAKQTFLGENDRRFSSQKCSQVHGAK